mgnify:FL=1
MEQSEDAKDKQRLDNIVFLPENKRKKTFILPEKEEDFGVALEQFCTLANGVHVSMNLDWRDIMIAMLISTANCGVNAKLTEEQFIDFLHGIKVGKLK